MAEGEKVRTDKGKGVIQVVTRPDDDGTERVIRVIPIVNVRGKDLSYKDGRAVEQLIGLLTQVEVRGRFKRFDTHQELKDALGPEIAAEFDDDDLPEWICVLEPVEAPE